jgi:hypothetical protein
MSVLAVFVNTTLTMLVVGTTTTALTVCPVVVAVLVTVVPAAETAGVTNRFNTALAPFTSVPIFHIPVALL